MNSLGAKILYVEEDEMTRFLVSDFLRKKGHQVAEAASAGEGLAQARNEPFDLCLLNTSGFDTWAAEFCREIRILDVDMGILFFSAEIEEASLKHASTPQFFLRPATVEDLENTVPRLLMESRVITSVREGPRNSRRAA